MRPAYLGRVINHRPMKNLQIRITLHSSGTTQKHTAPMLHIEWLLPEFNQPFTRLLRLAINGRKLTVD